MSDEVHATADRFYQCVCGEVLAVDNTQGSSCPACQRHYSANILNEAVADTMSIKMFDSPIVATNIEHETEKIIDAPQLGDMIDHFRVVNLLGKGGMGAVYRALDESLQRYVALKIIRRPQDAEADTTHVQQLLQEARAQARVNHPNVVHIYYVSRDETAPYLAMEMVGGSPLSKQLANGPIPFEDVIRIAIQLSSALLQAARFDIVHGDLKPSNVLIAEDGSVKLSDFGLARRLSEVGAENAPIMGTPNYLSPELAAGKPLSVQSDMYSLGVTLFEMTFGRLPYSGSGQVNLLEQLRAHREDPVEFPDEWPPELPVGWRDVLERLLAKSPSDRFQTYGELLVALERLRPVSLPQAGRFVRGLAWLVDMAIVSTTQQLVSAPWEVPMIQNVLQQRPLLKVMVALASIAIPFLAGLLFARLGSSAGKKLFQLRIVDRHGLKLKQSALFVRSITQLLPLWIIAASRIFEAIGIAEIGALLILGVVIGMLIDLGFALFHKRGQALHDLFFGTRVVLDV